MLGTAGAQIPDVGGSQASQSVAELAKLNVDQQAQVASERGELANNSCSMIMTLLRFDQCLILIVNTC